MSSQPMRALYKIAVTSSRTGWEDPDKRILDQSVWLASQGHQVVIVAPLQSMLFKRARAARFPVYPISFRRLSAVGEYKQLIRIFENEKPYAIKAHGHKGAGMVLSAAKKADVACRILVRHSRRPVRNTWYNRKIYRHLSHYTFTASLGISGMLRQTFKLREMDVFSLPPGMAPPESLVPRDSARVSLARSLDLDPGTRFIGLTEAGPKDLDVIAKAFCGMRIGIPHHLVIWDTLDRGLAETDAAAPLNDKIHVKKKPAKTAEIWPFFRAADACVFFPGADTGAVPSLLVNAMYCSCPVICTRAWGYTDLVDHGRSGRFFDPGDGDDLSGQILKTITREAATLEQVHRARESVKKSQTMDAAGRDIIRILRLHQVKLEKQYLPG